MHVHPTAEVSDSARIGEGTRVWHQVQIRERAEIGSECIIGKGAYIDMDVRVGNRVKIQNGAMLFHGLTVEDGVFIGPGACFTNDKSPRAITPEGALKGTDDWEVGPVRVCYGASVGAGAIVLPNVTIGRFALIGSGAVVARDVGAYTIVLGVPARVVGFVCACAQRLPDTEGGRVTTCARCKRQYRLVGEGDAAAGDRVACEPM